ncbi:MAG: recombinase family protein [Lachnospiraceae bacterium]|nr:recombinase family protein [Lachnospiraceae bacterium]
MDDISFRCFQKSLPPPHIVRNRCAFYEEEHGFTKKWTQYTVRGVLASEVYAGDILTLKSYISDYLTKTVKKNEGERQQYLLKDHHKAIIDRTTDRKVKAVKAANFSRKIGGVACP